MCSLNSLKQSPFFYPHFSVCNKSNSITAAQQVFHTGLRFILPSVKFSMAAEVWPWAVESSLRFPRSILPQIFQTSCSFPKTGLPFLSNQPPLVHCKGKAKNSPRNISLTVPLAQHPEKDKLNSEDRKSETEDEKELHKWCHCQWRGKASAASTGVCASLADLSYEELSAASLPPLTAEWITQTNGKFIGNRTRKNRWFILQVMVLLSEMNNKEITAS